MTSGGSCKLFAPPPTDSTRSVSLEPVCTRALCVMLMLKLSCQGNLFTLNEDPKQKGVDIRQELLKFHDRFYSSAVMKLVVLGRESLDDLQKMVNTLFSSVVNKPKHNFSIGDNVFAPQQTQLLFRVSPIKDIRRLVISFWLPSGKSLYHSKPVSLLSHLIGHESEGSILALLRKLNLVSLLLLSVSIF